MLPDNEPGPEDRSPSGPEGEEGRHPPGPGGEPSGHRESPHDFIRRRMRELAEERRKQEEKDRERPEPAD